MVETLDQLTTVIQTWRQNDPGKFSQRDVLDTETARGMAVWLINHTSCRSASCKGKQDSDVQLSTIEYDRLIINQLEPASLSMLIDIRPELLPPLWPNRTCLGCEAIGCRYRKNNLL